MKMIQVAKRAGIQALAVFALAALPPAVMAQTAFTGTKVHLPIVSVGSELYSVDLTLTDGAQLIFQLDPTSLALLTNTASLQPGDPVFSGTTLTLPLLYVGDTKYSVALKLIDATNYVFQVDPASLKVLGTRTPAPFSNASHIVSTSFFHWFAANGGQRSGPWAPVEGRTNWLGTAPWWKTQIKQVMSANIDVINVHLINSTEERRITLFQALNEMLAEGYDIPNVAPFLDPLITWVNQPKIDLATAAGRKLVADQYVRFYNQYFQYVTNANAVANIASIDGRPVLTTWHFVVNFNNIGSMQQSDLTTPLKEGFAGKAALFNKPPYMITTAINMPVLSFADERVATFEINQYYHETRYNNLTAVQLKPGYWDQNVRSPGSFLPRAGGTHYATAWNQVHAGVNRIYIESWNEYDEGTGIYAGATTPPVIAPSNTGNNSDTWSATANPFEYIHTTAKGAAKFNDTPELDATALANTLPAQMSAGGTAQATITLRNQGDAAWTGAAGFSLKQLPTDKVKFSDGVTVNDVNDEIPLYGGIFRGRPVTFTVQLTAPSAPGSYLTRWQMMKGGVPFGEVITRVIHVQ